MEQDGEHRVGTAKNKLWEAWAECVETGGGENVYSTVWLQISDHTGQTYVILDR